MSGSDFEDGVTIVRVVDPTKLTWPRSPEAAAAASNREFIDLSDLTWSEAEEALEQEEGLIRRIADAAALPLSELDIDAELDEGEYIGWLEEPWGCLDLGIAGVVASLSAAGCLTVSSCNGSRGHRESHPLVAFHCKRALLPILLECAERAECGMVNSSDGTAVVYATNVYSLLTFAREIIARRTSLFPPA